MEEKMPVQEPSTAEEMPSPSAEVTVTETTVTPSMPRSREWMQTKYPDKLWESDEAFDEEVATRLAEDDERLATYAASDERIARILDLNPDFWKVLDAMDKGMPFMTALRTYAGDLVEAIPAEDDEGFEEYQKAAEEYLAEKKRSDERMLTSLRRSAMPLYSSYRTTLMLSIWALCRISLCARCSMLSTTMRISRMQRRPELSRHVTRRLQHVVSRRKQRQMDCLWVAVQALLMKPSRRKMTARWVASCESMSVEDFNN